MASYQCHAAVMFADMRGFTSLSERLRPSQVFELLNEFFSALTVIAIANRGTVLNIAGDCLMVGFGVPEAQADCGARALRASRAMLMRFTELAETWRTRLDVETGLGIGINEGEVMAGNVGPDGYRNFTLIGDTVNIAARLGQRARAGEVLFSNRLKFSLNANEAQEMPMLALPPLVLRGRTNPIDIYCLPTDVRVDIRH